MNLISEELKKEAGLRIKASIVSSKLHLEYKINIYSGVDYNIFHNKGLVQNHYLVDSIKFKIKYRLEIERFDDKAFIIYPKGSFYRSLSMKYGIKVKHIRPLFGCIDDPNSILECKDNFYHINHIKISECDIKLDRVISSIHFIDPSWHRNYRINKILK